MDAKTDGTGLIVVRGTEKGAEDRIQALDVVTTACVLVLSKVCGCCEPLLIGLQDAYFIS